MNAYWDASAIAALVLRDGQAEAVRQWCATAEPVAGYSDFGWGELVSAISRRVRGRELRSARGRRAVERAAFTFRHWKCESITPQDVKHATDMVGDFSLKLRLPDAIHLAIARRTEAALITIDADQARAAAALGIAHVNPAQPT